MTELLETYGLALVFANVLAEQLGLPVPAMPTMMVAAALAAEEHASLAGLAAATLCAAMTGNAILYAVGERYGQRVMKLLCGISLSPDSCVRQASLRFERWGGWTLVLAKFLPGIGTIAPPLAGVMRFGRGRFLVLSTLGSALWIATALAVGALFHEQIHDILEALERYGARAAAAVIALVAAYIAFKWWERRRFYRTLRMARITVDELHSLFERKREPLVVDLRGAAERRREGSIPGARVMSFADVEYRLADLPRDRDIVFFCSCPNEASAASAAKLLADLGYARVRPLAGGFDAWVAAGYGVERAAV
ncbi:MAG TPA: rhodanese-like domain-containing protein [Burkholderiales bacterium]